jgi:hypothetical protein
MALTGEHGVVVLLIELQDVKHGKGSDPGLYEGLHN